MSMAEKLQGDAAYEKLRSMELNDDQARRILWCARTYGLINFAHGDVLAGVTYDGGKFTVGDADFEAAARLVK